MLVFVTIPFQRYCSGPEQTAICWSKSVSSSRRVVETSESSFSDCDGVWREQTEVFICFSAQDGDNRMWVHRKVCVMTHVMYAWGLRVKFWGVWMQTDCSSSQTYSCYHFLMVPLISKLTQLISWWAVVLFSLFSHLHWDKCSEWANIFVQLV